MTRSPCRLERAVAGRGHEGAVRTDEHDQHTFIARNIAETDRITSRHTGKSEVWGSAPESRHG